MSLIATEKNNDFFKEYLTVLENLLNEMKSFSDPKVEWIKINFSTKYGDFDLFTRSKCQCVNFISITDIFTERLFGEEKANDFCDRVIEEASDFHGVDVSDSEKTVEMVINWIKGIRDKNLIQ